MKSKPTVIIATLLVTSVLAMAGLFNGLQSTRAESEASPLSPEPAVLPLDAPTPDYTVLPSDTDGDQDDCRRGGVGCEGVWGRYAPNEPHALSVPSSKNTGKLLVFFTGSGGKPAAELYHGLYNVATQQGYHVIGLTYFTTTDDGGVALACRKDMSCYGNFMQEVIDGTDCVEDKCSELNISEHPQDSILRRLLYVLDWARATHPDDGWERYLRFVGDTETVNWEQIHLAGFSNGSGYAALMGIQHPEVKRVALFAGPNDGKGDSQDWVSADYIKRVEGVTDRHYFGLVHALNRAQDDGTSTLYKVTKAWRTLGMGTPYNPSRVTFDPDPDISSWDFLGTHMFISDDPETIASKAHTSIIRNEYVNCGNPAIDGCIEGNRIGYGPIWRCVLGTGDASVSSIPVADAGPNQTVECQGFGGAGIDLDGSGSKDADCDALDYLWGTPFAAATGWKPSVFLPLGTHSVMLLVQDPWRTSQPDTTLITVADTKPPSLQVSLTPATISTANHRLVRIHATITSSDVCGGAPIQVVLTSITSNEPDSGIGSGDIADDIQEADFGTSDLNFALRAEAYGSGRASGRIYTIKYTATDVSGNSRQVISNVRVL